MTSRKLDDVIRILAAHSVNVEVRFVLLVLVDVASGVGAVELKFKLFIKIPEATIWRQEKSPNEKSPKSPLNFRPILT